jgi:hypothetical protein
MESESIKFLKYLLLYIYIYIYIDEREREREREREEITILGNRKKLDKLNLNFLHSVFNTVNTITICKMLFMKLSF